jgi:16S rRNA processing protein RimM
MRKPISKAACIEAGFIKKTHGLSGDVMISFDEGMDGIFEEIEFIYIEIEGLLVPFFIDEFSVRSSITGNLKFANTNTQERAKPLVGCPIFIEREWIEHDDDGFNPMALKGFQVVDTVLGAIGVILDIEDYSGNYVLNVRHLNREVLIPLNEELIHSINWETQTLVMDCPNGLIDLND